MDLDRLSLFLKVAELGSVSAASRAVHLTQPAVSRNLKLLEDELGAALFERTARRMVLTPAGRSLLPRARELLEDAGRIARDVRRAAGQAYHDLRIGAVDSVATFLLPRALEGLREHYPELAVKVHTGRTAELMRRVDADELDVALVAYSSPPPSSASRVGPYRMRYYGRADRFPGLAEARTDAELRAFPLVEIEALPGQPTMIRSDAEQFVVAASLASVKAFVMEGFGVGALLDFMLTPEERRVLVCAEQAPHDPDCALFVVDRPVTSGSDLGVVARTLAELIAEQLDRPRP